MPKQGPKKFTKRDERNQDRKVRSGQRHSTEVIAEREERVLQEYKSKRNPNLPTTKCEQRALRAALAAEGISMSVWSSGLNLSGFADIARERFVNTKYCEPAHDLDMGDFESDPWLQMFLHTPQDYRDEIDSIKPFTMNLEINNKAKQSERKKLSRRKAKELLLHKGNEDSIDGVSSVVVSVAAIGTDAPTHTTDISSTDSTHTITTPQQCDEKIIPTVPPLGRVHIRSTTGSFLTADTAGRLNWTSHSPTESNTSLYTCWILAKTTSTDKYTLYNSGNSKYLCHCLYGGWVADRTVPQAWEDFSIQAISPTSTSGEYVFSLQSWRGINLSFENKDGLFSKHFYITLV